jgi:hypothetical protein
MYSFRPQPEPSEREALLIALRQLLPAEDEQLSAYDSEWRRAAFEEGVSAGDDNEPSR